jgi:Raf kinase inhibitor-like YbhB/YbcL family protein
MSQQTRKISCDALQWLFLLCALSVPGCGGEQRPVDDPTRLTIRLTSQSFAEGGTIPREFTCDGADRSPPLEWSGVPESALALVLLCEDPDAPAGIWTHWVLIDLPAELRSLEAGAGTPPAPRLETVSAAKGPELTLRQGKNDFGKIGYGGPCPPSGTHRYFFRLYALDKRTDLDQGTTRTAVLKAIEGHVLAEGRLMGRYTRSA